jgi:superfamily I DNA/RNA helicase
MGRPKKASVSKVEAKPTKPSWYKAHITKQPRVIREWSTFQKNIFDDIATGTGNTQVDALAGTGKTSTIVEGFYYIPKGTSSLMCAFNKKIQEELETRAPEGVDVKTLHSLGFAACKRAFPRMNPRPDDKGEKLDGFIRAEKGDEPESYELRGNLSKAVALCKGYLAHTTEEIDPILDRHDIDPCTDSREEFIASVIKVLNACKRDTSRCDFDDMIWLPNVHDIRLNQYGFVMIDEAQDLNPAQINLSLNSCGQGGRILSVGDRFQAIYGFRGADSNAIQNIVDRLGSKRLPLSVTYRCAKNIVELAKTLVPELEAGPNAEDGTVQYIFEKDIEKLVKPGDFILSRVNAPLLKWCLTLLKARIPANIQGRDIGQSLTSLIKKSRARNVSSFLDWLNDYADLEVNRMVKAKRDPSAIQDKVDCLHVLCEGMRNLDEVRENIESLFRDGDDKNRVILSSTHKAKGLERDNVFLLRDTYRPTRGQEEANLLYVAITRAKKNLYLVSK